MNMIAIMPAFGETHYAIFEFAVAIFAFMAVAIIIIVAISMINNLLK